MECKPCFCDKSDFPDFCTVGYECCTWSELVDSIKLAKLVENFSVITQSSQHAILKNNTVLCIWLFSLTLGGARNRF